MFVLILNTHYTGKLIHVGYFKQIKDIMPSLILSIVVFGCVLLTNTLTDNLIAQILIGGLTGTLIYLGGSYLMHFSELEEVRYLLSRRQ